MRILGIDYGEARVGIAITDQLNITVQGLETIQRNGSDKVILRRLDEIFEKYTILLNEDKNAMYRMKELWGYMSHIFTNNKKYYKKNMK